MAALFQSTPDMIKNYKRLEQEYDLKIIYYSINEREYKAVIKTTEDKSELYLLSIFINKKEAKG